MGRTRTLATTSSLTALLVALPLSAAAQQLATDDPVLRGIWAEARDNSQLEQLAQSLLDSIGPRLTASPQMERAQAWAVERFRSWGIEARTERYGTWEGWDRGPSHVDLIAPRTRSLEGRILAWSPGTAGKPIEGEVLSLPAIRAPGDWTAFLGTVHGKWVMLSAPEPTCRTDAQWREFALPGSFERMDSARDAARALWNANLRTANSSPRLPDLHRALEQAGALGIVTSEWPGSYGTTRVFDAYNRGTPTFELSCEDYGMVNRLAVNEQQPVLRLTAEAESRGEVPVFNVIAEIPGRELPEEYVILSAHFDSWDSGSGATDNGSGSLLMMEVARILKSVLPNPRRTIMVGLWSGEEQGLIGSRAFTEDHPEVIDGLQAIFNQDNGTGRIVNVSAQGLTRAAGSLARWMALVPAEVSQYVRMDLPGTPSSGGSDYSSFICWGAPALPLGALSWNYSSDTWHTHRDTFDKLIFDDLKNNAVLTASLAYLASEDPERVSRERRALIASRQGRQSGWPACQPAQRHSPGSDPM